MSDKGRWPANVILDDEAAAILDAQTEGKVHSAGHARTADEGTHSGGHGVVGFTYGAPAMRYGDTGGVSRFFARANSREEVTEWLVRLITPPGGTVLLLRETEPQKQTKGATSPETDAAQGGVSA